MRSALELSAPEPGRRVLAPPTSTSSSDLGPSNNPPRTRYGPAATVHGVAASCPFIRVANIGTLARYAPRIIAPRSDRPPPRLHSNHQRNSRGPPSATSIQQPLATTLESVIATLNELSALTSTATRHDTSSTRYNNNHNNNT